MNKSTKIFSALILLCQFALAQQPVTEYYDEDFVRVRKEKAVYYRIVTYKDSVPTGIVRDYYLSGKLQWEGKLNKEGRNEGWCIWYYENGNKQAEGNYTDGYAIGLHKSWYDNNILKSEGSYVPGNGDERRGIWIYYYPNGKKRYEGSFTLNDEKDGIFNMYYTNGKLWAKGNYVQGITQGIVDYYDEKGKLHLVLLTDGQRDLVGVMNSTFWIEELNNPYRTELNKKEIRDKFLSKEPLKKQMHFYGLDGDFKNGKNIKKYDDGSTECEFSLVNDKMEGKYIKYHKNGKKAEEGIYLSNYRNGIWKSWNETGELEREGSYKNGRLDGTLKRFRYNKQIGEDTYKDGLREGSRWYVEFDHYTFMKPLEIIEEIYADDTLRGFKTWYFDTLTFEKKQLKSDLNKIRDSSWADKVKNKNGDDAEYFGFGNKYYENGQPAFISHYDSVSSRINYEEFFEDGKKKAEGEIRNRIVIIKNSWDSNGKALIINGNGKIFRKHHDDMRTESTYEGGYLAKEIIRYGNGNIYFESNYKNGLQDGYQTTYSPEGNKQQEILYRAGKEIQTKVWYPNKNLKQEMNFKGDRSRKQHGLIVHYYENGKKSYECIYNNGEKTGTEQYWDESGKLIKEITYDEFGDVLE
jgi:uncharacterized protein